MCQKLCVKLGYPPTSTDISWYGEKDTASLEKKVMVVVSATFSIGSGLLTTFILKFLRILE